MSGTGFCEVCTGRIEGRRGDAKHCSAACTRRAYAERPSPPSGRPWPTWPGRSAGWRTSSPGGRGGGALDDIIPLGYPTPLSE